MIQKPRLLITGANGFTGEHACSHFSKCGYEVIAVTRSKDIRSDSIQTEHCDLTDKNSVYQLISKIQPNYLLHLAGINHVGNSWENPLLTLESNLLSTLYIIEATRKLNPSCKILIVGSTLQTDINQHATLTHPYGLSKSLQVIISQAWVKFYKMKIVIAKPTNLIGPGKSNGVNAIIAEKIVKMENNEIEKVLMINNLNTRIDFLDVRDVVVAYETLITKGVTGEEYEIFSGKDNSLRELINIYKSLTPIDFKVESLSNEEEKQSIIRQSNKLQALGWSPKYSASTSVTDILNYHRLKNPRK